MEFKGTKGKWEYKITKKGHAKISGLDWSCFAKIYTITDGGSDKKNETKANALLISKAPELLEMLMRAENWCASCNQNASIVKDIQKLIKEATELK